MTGRAAFELWAPAGARWADWARPVPFVAMAGAPAPLPAADPIVPPILYLDGPQPGTAIFVDLPGPAGVWEGVALAGLGFRPVPLYNGTSPQPGTMALVDTAPVEDALHRAAGALGQLALPMDAPPAFLLDSNRTHRHRMDPAIFDNSWDLYHQDIPSADYFRACGIRSIIIRGAAVQKDLRRIFHKFQKKGIAFFFTDGRTPPRAVRLHKPLGGS